MRTPFAERRMRQPTSDRTLPLLRLVDAFDSPPLRWDQSRRLLQSPKKCPLGWWHPEQRRRRTFDRERPNQRIGHHDENGDQIDFRHAVCRSFGCRYRRCGTLSPNQSSTALLQIDHPAAHCQPVQIEQSLAKRTSKERRAKRGFSCQDNRVQH